MNPTKSLIDRRLRGLFHRIAFTALAKRVTCCPRARDRQPQLPALIVLERSRCTVGAELTAPCVSGSPRRGLGARRSDNARPFDGSCDGCVRLSMHCYAHQLARKRECGCFSHDVCAEVHRGRFLVYRRTLGDPSQTPLPRRPLPHSVSEPRPPT
jgi:hypothetical protein